VYGKIFASMYEGTLYGQWEALVTFQQMIVLSDADGIVDMTPYAIAARTSIPVEIISKGIKVLLEPDIYSRTPDQDGRRIELIDAHRPWGYHIVNHAKYAAMKDADTIRAQTRERVRKHRASRDDSVTVTHGNASKRHTDTDTDTKKGIVGLTPSTTPLAGKAAFKSKAVEVLDFLNEKTGRSYEAVPANLDLIVARLKDGATTEDLRAVVAKKCREWRGDEKMDSYLRPKTLFNRTNYAQYRGEIGNAQTMP